MNIPSPIQAAVQAVYEHESRRVLATLVRLLGDFDLAEEALQDAFATALAQWPNQGIPANPRAWLVSVGRNKAVDALRRRARHDTALGSLAHELSSTPMPSEAWAEDADIPDDRLRLMFTCCHPALSLEAQVALTLRTVCGLTTEAIASGFLLPAPTLAQRIVRAKAKIRTAGIPYEEPARADLPSRLHAVLNVVYLIFNEGYFASSGEAATRPDLSGEAIRLGRLLAELLPEPEVHGLLALMLLQDSRRAARSQPDGQPILLEEQNRSQWDAQWIGEGLEYARRALAAQPAGSYALQAAIAAQHAKAATYAQTDWAQIVALYDALLQVQPSPVVELNRAVAVAMRDGPAAGLILVDGLLAGEALHAYALAHAARADLLRRMGEREAAQAAYQRALALTEQEPQRVFLRERLRQLES
ncbi:MAG: RNA polymerase sigma factor [Anaerolineales bacterium]|nr:RNA polymerase sigma factor [Anaerolineales bacterium]